VRRPSPNHETSVTPDECTSPRPFLITTCVDHSHPHCAQHTLCSSDKSSCSFSFSAVLNPRRHSCRDKEGFSPLLTCTHYVPPRMQPEELDKNNPRQTRGPWYKPCTQTRRQAWSRRQGQQMQHLHRPLPLRPAPPCCWHQRHRWCQGHTVPQHRVQGAWRTPGSKRSRAKKGRAISDPHLQRRREAASTARYPQQRLPQTTSPRTQESRQVGIGSTLATKTCTQYTPGLRSLLWQQRWEVARPQTQSA
jgi:hypothetical protein